MDAVLNWLWQGSVVAVACFVMLRVLERARANVRYVVCWAALLLIVVLPALPSLPSTTPADAFAVTQGGAIVSLPDAWWTSTLVMLAVWMAWTAVCTIKLISAMVALRRARRCSRGFPSHVESDLPHWSRARYRGRHATLVLSDSVTTAAVLGGGRPMIAVAPSLLTTLDAGELDRVLIHEWAHVQRRDDLGHVLQIVVRTVAGWHPAVWWVDRRLHVEREIACDEISVAITGSPKSYAECLMRLASLRSSTRAMRAAPAMLTVSGLRARVTKVLSPHPWIAPVWSRTIAVAIVSTLCMLSAAVGGLNLVEATTFALPFESTSSRIVSPTLDTIAPVAVPRLAKPAKKERSRRQSPASAPPAQRPEAKEPARPPLQPEPDAPRTAATAKAVEPPPSTVEGIDDHAVVSESATVVRTPAPQPPDVRAEQPRSPWSAAADGGVAIGRQSKTAGVATAGFFTRFARRVAGSF
jgi:bla regulator protein blaR1